MTSFRGTSLRPIPPGASKHRDVRYFDIREAETIDARAFKALVKAAVAQNGPPVKKR